ncbi:MAG TPA: NAD(P)H-dependent oxidoreductase [Hyphomicrobiales bacterium]|nr:NAD(P)H-dependent oxidoreductase [Hyphomicrobiales bacterium]
MADRLKVIAIGGSLRKGSYNAAVLRALPGLAPPDMTIALGPTLAMPLYDQDVQDQAGFPPEAHALCDAVRAADGVAIVSPEYNYSVPGFLKNGLDWVSRMPNQPFKNKPIVLMSATLGPLGGARVQYHLRQIMVFLEAFTFNRPEVFVGNAASKIDAAGAIHDETTLKFIRDELAGFAGFIRRIQAGHPAA